MVEEILLRHPAEQPPAASADGAPSAETETHGSMPEQGSAGSECEILAVVSPENMLSPMHAASERGASGDAGFFSAGKKGNIFGKLLSGGKKMLKTKRTPVKSATKSVAKSSRRGSLPPEPLPEGAEVRQSPMIQKPDPLDQAPQAPGGARPTMNSPTLNSPAASESAAAESESGGARPDAGSDCSVGSGSSQPEADLKRESADPEGAKPENPSPEEAEPEMTDHEAAEPEVASTATSSLPSATSTASENVSATTQGGVTEESKDAPESSRSPQAAPEPQPVLQENGGPPSMPTAAEILSGAQESEAEPEARCESVPRSTEESMQISPSPKAKVAAAVEAEPRQAPALKESTPAATFAEPVAKEAPPDATVTKNLPPGATPTALVGALAPSKTKADGPPGDKPLTASKPSNLASGIYSFKSLVKDGASMSKTVVPPASSSFKPAAPPPALTPKSTTTSLSKTSNPKTALEKMSKPAAAHALKLEQIREKQKADRLHKEKERQEREAERAQRMRAQMEKAEQERALQKQLLKEKAAKVLEDRNGTAPQTTAAPEELQRPAVPHETAGTKSMKPLTALAKHDTNS